MSGFELSPHEVEKSLDRVRSFAVGGEFAAVFSAFDELRTSVDALERQFIDGLRESMTWAEIGPITGVTKQAAHRRYQRLLRSTA